MVYAVIIHTVQPKDCDILYYRVFAPYAMKNAEAEISNYDRQDSESVHSEKNLISSKQVDVHKKLRSSERNIILFETSAEKKEFLNYIVNKVQMQYYMKIDNSVLPLSSQDDYKDTPVKGTFMERDWKSCDRLPIVWQVIRGLGFVLVCKKHENCVQAHNVIDILISQLEKHLQFTSNPTMALSLIETIALVINQFLPSGLLVFMSNKLVKSLEKKLEADLYAK